MVSAILAHNIDGIICNIISFCLFFSTLSMCYKIIKNKSVEEFKPDLYIAILLTNIFWIFYGMSFVHLDNVFIVTINGIALAIELVYLTIFVFFADNKGWKKMSVRILVEVIFVVVIVHITMQVLHRTKNISLMVEIICDIFNFMIYISPLTIMKKVIAKKSFKYMKYPLYKLIRNSVGVTSSLFQLILYAYYAVMMSSKEDEDHTEKESN